MKGIIRKQDKRGVVDVSRQDGLAMIALSDFRGGACEVADELMEKEIQLLDAFGTDACGIFRLFLDQGELFTDIGFKRRGRREREGWRVPPPTRVQTQRTRTGPIPTETQVWV